MLAARTSAIALLSCSRIIVHSLVRRYKQTAISIDAPRLGAIIETKPFIYSHAFMPAVVAGNYSVQTPPRFKPDKKKQDSRPMILRVIFMLTPEPFTTLQVKHMAFHLCFSYTGLLENIYTCQCLPFNELLLSNCLHQPIKTFAHVTNVA